MDEFKIDAVAMVRRIRDEGYERLKHATAEEKVRYFQEASARFRTLREAERAAARHQNPGSQNG